MRYLISNFEIPVLSFGFQFDNTLYFGEKWASFKLGLHFYLPAAGRDAAFRLVPMLFAWELIWYAFPL